MRCPKPYAAPESASNTAIAAARDPAPATDEAGDGPYKPLGIPGKLALATALGLAAFGLVRGPSLDEYTTLLMFKHASLLQAMQALRYDTHHPLYFALLYLWHAVAQSLSMWRLLSLGLHALALVSLVAAARRASVRRCAGREAAIWAVLLWGISPAVLGFATQLRPYSLLGLATAWTLATHLAPRASLACPKGLLGRMRVAEVTSGLVLVCSHPVGIMAYVALWPLQLLGAPLVQQQTHGRWQLDVQAAAGHALRLSCVGGAFLALHFGFSLHTGYAGIEWMPPVSLQLVSRTLAELTGRGPLGGVLFAWGVVAVYGALGWTHSVGRRLVCSALCHAVLVAGYSAMVTPIFYYRALCPAWVMVTLAAALGLSGHKTPLRQAACAACLVIVLLCDKAWLGRGRQDADALHQLGTQVRKAWLRDEAIWVYPDWLDTAVMAEQVGEGVAAVQPLPRATAAGAASDAAAFEAASGILIIRLDAAGTGITDGLTARLRVAQPIRPRLVLAYISDDDDVMADAQERAALDAEARTLIEARFIDCMAATRTGRYQMWRCAPED